VTAIRRTSGVVFSSIALAELIVDASVNMLTRSNVHVIPVITFNFIFPQPPVEMILLFILTPFSFQHTTDVPITI
jgi:hypothetical protein